LRSSYAVQWVFIPPILLGVLFAPESPTWLVRKGRLDDARASLRRLTRRSAVSDDELEDSLALLRSTNELERSLDEGTSYADCFRGSNRRRTEIACVAWAAQVACGIWFGGNVTYFLEQAGFDSEHSFDLGLGTNGIALAGTLGAWFVMLRLGRRTLYLLGLSVMMTVLLIVGFMGIPEPIPALGWASGAFMMLYVVIYDLTVGPVCYCLVAEIPSTRLRIKTAVIARNTYNIVSILANFLNPPILNPSAWNLRGRGGFIWAVPCGAVLLWSWFRLPEAKGRSPAELDILFERGVKARKFRDETVEPFSHKEGGVAPSES
jgi:SP family general alpha glucoside:H+ symporter-like MFS transporter